MRSRHLLTLALLACTAVPAAAAGPDPATCRRDAAQPAFEMPIARLAPVGPLIRESLPEDEAELVGRVDETRYAAILAELSGYQSFELDGQTRQIQTRWAPGTAHPDGINLARDYLADRFAAAGYNVLLQDFEFTYSAVPVTATNVIAIRPGTTVPEEILVVGAHYDSISQDPSLDAPGAEDNASGTAAVLHLAELVAGFETERTIHFVGFGCEEYSLRGSRHYVEEAVAAGDNIVAALTMDMISAWVDEFGVLIEGTPAFVDLIGVVEGNVGQWTSLSSDTSLNSFGSDHVPFQQAGIPAILAIDLDWDQYDDYHNVTDTFDKVDTSLGTEITKVIAGSIADIASLSVRNVSIEEPLPGTQPARNRLALHGNAPNPFNPRTTISFTLPSAGMTRLQIFDNRGRRVRALSTEFLEPGLHQRVWDGMDESGQPVASGVYFSRLVHPHGVRTHSLTLVR